MKVDPFFSIIIPTFNRASFILKCIESVLKQEFQDFEIVIIDDGSTDNTEELVRSVFSDKIRYFKKANEERAVARNYGAKLSAGKYLNFLDSDDLLYPNHLPEAKALINNFHFPEFLHLGYDSKEVDGSVLKTFNNFSGNLNEKLVNGNFLCTSGVFLRRDIALKFPFNPDRDLSTVEDYELWLRLAARFPLVYSNKVTSTLVNHSHRSVLEISKNRLIKSQELFLKYLWQDKMVCKKYYQYHRKFTAEVFSYIALHLALTKRHRILVFKYLAKSIFELPVVIGTKRFWATLINLI